MLEFWIVIYGDYGCGHYDDEYDDEDGSCSESHDDEDFEAKYSRFLLLL